MVNKEIRSIDTNRLIEDVIEDMERDSSDILELKLVITELKLLASKYSNKTPIIEATSDSFCKYSLPLGDDESYTECSAIAKGE